MLHNNRQLSVEALAASFYLVLHIFLNPCLDSQPLPNNFADLSVSAFLHGCAFSLVSFRESRFLS